MKVLKLFACLAIIAAIVVVAVYFMGMWEPTKPVADTITGLGNQAKDYVQANLPTVIAGAGTLTAIGGAALSKINDAKQKVTDVTTTANSQINGLLQEKEKIAQQFDSAKTELESTKTQLTEISGKFKEADSVIQQQEQDILALKREKQELWEELKAIKTTPEVIYK